MRTRYKARAVEYLKTHPKNQFFLDNFDVDAFSKYISLNNVFLEIGPGKGQFIVNIAIRNPNVNYLVCELNASICGVLLKKIDDQEIENVKIICGNVYKLAPFFKLNNLEGIYLNFSDPWPKKRHEKRRLTSDDFLVLYANILKMNGKIFLKTDNNDFFTYSLEQFNKFNFKVYSIDYDYKCLENFNDEKTEFETKFIDQGIHIKRVVLIKTEETRKELN